MDYTVEEVIAWLKSRSPRETYDYTDNETCLFARFLSDMGHQHVSVIPRHWTSSRGTGRVPHEVNEAAVRARTMGDALAYLTNNTADMEDN